MAACLCGAERIGTRGMDRGPWSECELRRGLRPEETIGAKKLLQWDWMGIRGVTWDQGIGKRVVHWDQGVN